MAVKHRKLVPASETYQTADCIDVCDPTCADVCNPYPDPYYTPPISLPPPLSSTDHGTPIPSYAIVIAASLTSVFLLVGLYAAVAKYRSWRTRARSSDRDEEFLEENQSIDHPIWYITTVGLQPSVINSITVVRYTKGDSLVEGNDCSVCLNEFREDETLRLLPKCNHAFHIPCIDTWLRSHTNCPLCRSGILSNISTVPAPSPDLHGLGSNVNTQIQNPQTVVETGRNDGRETEIPENRGETEDGSIETLSIEDERTETEDSKKEHDTVGVETRTNSPRRSISADLVVEILLREDGICGFEFSCSSAINPIEERSQIAAKGTNDSSYSRSPHQNPVSAKRSFSGRW